MDKVLVGTAALGAGGAAAAVMLSSFALAAVLPAAWAIGRTGYGFWKIKKSEERLSRPADGILENCPSVLIEGSDEVPISSLVPDDTDNALGFRQVLHGGDPVFASAEMDAALRETDFTLKDDARKADRVARHIVAEKKALVPVLHLKSREAQKKGKSFFNDAKFCLSRNLDIRGRVAYHHRGSYFDSFLTNEICTMRLVQAGGGSTVDYRGYFPGGRDSRGRPALRTLSWSDMDDHVGISSLGLSSDGFLLIWQQAPSAQQSVGMWVPTGSGSCEWTDRRGDSLNTTIAYAMQREIWEESLLEEAGVAVEDIGETRLLGFFRWIRRGGKPEFAGITRLRVPADEFWPNPMELATGYSDCARIRCSNLKELRAAIQLIRSWPTVSVPLLHILDGIEQLLKKDPSYVREFWFGNAPGVDLKAAPDQHSG